MRANKNYKSAKKKIKDFRNRDAGVNPKVAEKKRLEGEDAASAVEAGYSTSPMRVKNGQGQTVLEVSQADTKEYRRQMGGSPAEKKASESKEYMKTTKKYSKGGKTIKMSKYSGGGEVDPKKKRKAVKSGEASADFEKQRELLAAEKELAQATNSLRIQSKRNAGSAKKDDQYTQAYERHAAAQKSLHGIYEARNTPQEQRNVVVSNGELTSPSAVISSAKRALQGGGGELNPGDRLQNVTQQTTTYSGMKKKMSGR